MVFQNAKREMKAVYGHSDSESSDNEHRKALHVMFGASWEITSQHVIKTLRREVTVTTPAPRVAPHCMWIETPISFNASDYPKSMAGAGQLPLIISSTISNIKLYHILINGGAALNLISLVVFKKLQILMLKLSLSHPFSRVGSMLVLRGFISLSVTFGTPENFHTESVLFDVAQVNLPFNAILGRPALYQFMAVAHYGYLVLKMPSPNDVLKIHRDRDACVSTLEKLQALAASREAAARPVGKDPAPLSSRQHGSTSAPHVQPLDNEGVPVKTIQIGADAAQTTRIMGDLDSK
jgi:hypothetical protein